MVTPARGVPAAESFTVPVIDPWAARKVGAVASARSESKDGIRCIGRFSGAAGWRPARVTVWRKGETRGIAGGATSRRSRSPTPGEVGWSKDGTLTRVTSAPLDGQRAQPVGAV